MKKLIFIVSLFAAFSAHAQNKTATLAYSLDTIRLDSFYLVEVFTAAPTAQAPRPNSETRYQFFADTAQVRLYVANLNKDAKAYYDQAILLATKAKGINDLISQSPWFTRKKPEKKTEVTGAVIEEKKPAKKPKKKKQ
jgi:hypothetical protein